MAGACAFAGKPELYGLGIRTSFYLLWFAGIVAGWVARPVVPVARMALSLFSAAVFLATLLAVSGGSAGAHPKTVETYLLLLLFYGAYYVYVPLYLWRLATGCSPFWNPYGWRRVEPGRAWAAANYVLLVATTGFQLWFWTTGINSEPSRDADGCPEWGFFFAPVLLRNPLFIALNIVITVAVLLCVVVHLMFDIKMVRPPRWLRKKNRKARKRRISTQRRVNLHLLGTIMRSAVAGLMVAAVELTLQWNNIQGVYDATSSGQLIPLILASGLFGYIFWIFFTVGFAGDDDGSSSSSSTHSGERAEVVN